MSRKSDRKKRKPGLFARLIPGGGDKSARGRGRKPRLAERAWVKPALAAGAGLCVLGAAGGTVLWGVQSGTFARWQTETGTAVVDATRRAGFALDRVYVTGRRETDRQDILAAVGADVGAPILTLDPGAIRARLEDLGWIASAKVERRLPGTLVLRIEERQAAAIWQREGDHVLIDRTGAVIGPEDVTRHKHLKLVVGPGAPENTADLLEVLEREPAMMARVVAAIWLGERRWNLRLDNGVDVRLPEQDPVGAWRRLARLERDHEILERAVDAIDLRQDDRAIVRMTRDGMLQIKARREGEET